MIPPATLVAALLLLPLSIPAVADPGLSGWEDRNYLYIRNPEVRGHDGGPLVLRTRIPPDDLLNQQSRHMNRCNNREAIERPFGRYRLRYVLPDHTELAKGEPPLSAEVAFNKMEQALTEIAATDFAKEINAIPNPVLQYCPYRSDDPSYFDGVAWKESGRRTYRINLSDTPLRKGGLRLTTLLIHEFSHAYDHLLGMETPLERQGLERLVVRGECVAYMKQLHALQQLGGYDDEIYRVTRAMLIPKPVRKELARNLKSYRHCDLFREEMERRHPKRNLFADFDAGGRLDTAQLLPLLLDWNRSFSGLR